MPAVSSAASLSAQREKAARARSQADRISRYSGRCVYSRMHWNANGRAVDYGASDLKLSRVTAATGSHRRLPYIMKNYTIKRRMYCSRQYEPMAFESWMMSSASVRRSRQLTPHQGEGSAAGDCADHSFRQHTSVCGIIQRYDHSSPCSIIAAS